MLKILLFTFINFILKIYLNIDLNFNINSIYYIDKSGGKSDRNLRENLKLV